MTHRLRIMLMTDTFRAGGTERFLLRLAAHLDRERFDVLMGCISEAGEFRSLVPADVPVSVHPFPEGFASWSGLRHLVRWVRDLRRLKVDLLLTGHAYLNSRLGLPARLAGVRVVAGQRGDLTPDRTSERVLSALADHLAHGVIANSAAVAARTTRRERLPARKMRLVHNGAPPVNRDDLPALRQTTRDQLGLAADEPLLLCLARIHPEKGQIVLVKALSRLAAQGIRLPLLLVGDGELGAVRLEAARLGVLGQLITPGSTNAPLRYLAAADLFVLPSLTESFPNALVEAMQIGLPCVASDVGGVSEILSDGVTGLLVPPGDPEALAQALAQFVTDRPLAARLGEAAQRRVLEDFTLEGMVRRIEDILLELTGEDRHGH